MNKDVEIRLSHIIHNIVDFYSLQPGIKKETLEKIETFLLMVSAPYVKVCNQIDDLKIADSDFPVEELLDVINGYLNYLGEEFEKIFQDMENPFQPIICLADSFDNYLAFVETLRGWNGQSQDFYMINESLDILEGEVVEESFDVDRLWDFTSILTEKILQKMVIFIEDLL